MGGEQIPTELGVANFGFQRAAQGRPIQGNACAVRVERLRV